MELFVSDKLIEVLSISLTLSIVMFSVIQKFKTLSFINKNYQLWLINLVLSFAIGIPFGISFYNLTVEQTLWLSLFSFVGAPGIYEAFKKQTMINYTPKTLNNNISVPKENIIERADL